MFEDLSEEDKISCLTRLLIKLKPKSETVSTMIMIFHTHNSYRHHKIEIQEQVNIN